MFYVFFCGSLSCTVMSTLKEIPNNLLYGNKVLNLQSSIFNSNGAQTNSNELYAIPLILIVCIMTICHNCLLSPPFNLHTE